MSSLNNKFYAIFEKQKLVTYIENLRDKKTDLAWISYLVSFLGAIFLTYKYSKQSNLTTVDGGVIAVGWIAIFIFLGLTIYYFIKWVKCLNLYKSIEDDLSEISIAKEYTTAFIIKNTQDNKQYILVKEGISSGYWLPYYRRVDRSPKKSELLEYLEKNFSIKAKITELDDRSLNDVVKEKRNKEYSTISYKFYLVEFYTDFINFKNKVLKHDDEYKFITIDEMKSNSLTIKTNFDILSHLEESMKLDSLNDSFNAKIANEKLNNLKVIWNITKECDFNCKFCATNSGMKDKELNFHDRIKILEELMKIDNLNLDIAGGDPLSDSNVVSFLTHISKYMTKDFTVTTTGLALEKYSNNNISKIYQITNEYDISYDFPKSWGDEEHRGKNYNELNHKYIKQLIESGLKVNILITLFEKNTQDDDAILSMIDEIKNLNAESITLLRLMPVGRQNYSKYPKSIDFYNPLKAIEMFKKEFGNKVKLHCAFRANAETKSKNYCNMLTEKIGVDNMGNVFSCAWAGYLPNVELEENPFFLGNLLEKSIEEIFSSEKYVKLSKLVENKQMNFCPIFSYLENKNDWTKNNDNFKEWTS